MPRMPSSQVEPAVEEDQAGRDEQDDDRPQREADGRDPVLARLDEHDLAAGQQSLHEAVGHGGPSFPSSVACSSA